MSEAQVNNPMHGVTLEAILNSLVEDSMAEILKGQVEQGRDVVVNVNNHYEGCAVMTIDRLVGRMG